MERARITLRQIVDGVDTPLGRLFDWVIIGLITFSIIALPVETLPRLNPGIRRFLDASEVVITLLFTIEYLLRLAAAPSKKRYGFSFYGLIDLLAVLPFYLSLGFDLRPLRAFRLLRLLRLLKLARYHRAAQWFVPS